MAQKSLEAADVALLLLDAEEGVTKLDAAIGGYAEESGCSVIIVLNKWDLAEKDTHTLESSRIVHPPDEIPGVCPDPDRFGTNRTARFAVCST